MKTLASPSVSVPKNRKPTVKISKAVIILTALVLALTAFLIFAKNIWIIYFGAILIVLAAFYFAFIHPILQLDFDLSEENELLKEVIEELESKGKL